MDTPTSIDSDDLQFDSSLCKASILLVDDNPANLVALEATLEPLGHRLVKARSGAEALRHLLNEDFALILMDVQMPELDGFQTVALIKQRRKSLHIPVIFVTAIAKEASEISRGYEYGAVDYMTKPFDPDILRAKVSVLIALYLQAEHITRQRELLLERREELRRRQADKDAADVESRMKDQFLAIVSHELRTPLNAIMGWTDMLVKGNLDPDRTRRALDAIQRNAALQKQLVDDLLDISRMVTGKFALQFAPISLTAIGNAAIDTVRPEAERRHIKLVSKFDVSADAAKGDANRLQQVLWNLLTNAIKFTPEGGRIELRMTRVGTQAQIEIEDNGRGIDPEDLPYVFNRFWQADRGGDSVHPGLGLGLAIVRQLVDLHGGGASVRSEGTGKGATFTVTLPLETAMEHRSASVEQSS